MTLLAAPIAVPVSMWAVFGALSRRLPPRAAYNVGFVAYWAGWCVGFPLWVLGPRRAGRVLAAGRRPSAAELALLTLPVAGAAATQLLPMRRQVDPGVAAVMVGTAVVNAVGEELLWRGVYLEELGDDVVRGAVWPLVGFAAWHLAPQRILPAAVGRWNFAAGAALVGAASTRSAWRERGLRTALLAHVLTDACGVTAARFRLGR